MNELLPSDLSILLIEASDLQRKIISRYLNKENIQQLQTAKNMTQALHIIERHPPDLIVSAMHFNDGTALDLLTKINTTPQWKNIQFMLVSSENRKEQLDIYRQSGVVAILPKPFTSLHLGKAINATIDLLSYDEIELAHFDVHHIRVLLVDDSHLARKMIKRTINNLGISKITEAKDGKEAIHFMQQQMFDLVITDYNMPSIDGLALAQFIRLQSPQPYIPILMVSSQANDANLNNVHQAGVDALCDKPFEPRLVKNIIYQLLE
ncbi:response regulator [uncultured Shewanella sp.]|uniref:response regulator n=1 Tax=uncultured Shewanella sp. TaxID=173975 RepID=UPI0026339619|nr:response regulator [uncultured Shewanella sp.]